MLEGALRDLFCAANGRLGGKRPLRGSFYAKIDGVGQAGRHDVVLMPFLDGGDVERNALVATLGAPLASYLVDLFLSPCRGPNVLATAAHGTWDALLVDELEGRPADAAAPAASGASDPYSDMEGVSCALVAALDCLVSVAPADPEAGYRPAFTYTTVYHAAASAIVASLSELDALVTVSVASGEGPGPAASEALDALLAVSPPPWDAEAYFADARTNDVLASRGAGAVLLQEAAHLCNGAVRRLATARGAAGLPTSSAAISAAGKMSTDVGAATAAAIRAAAVLPYIQNISEIIRLFLKLLIQ